MSNEIILVLIVVLSPVIWFSGGFLFKLLWGWWPVPTFPGIGGYMVYQGGMDNFIFIPVGLLASIIVSWLWQRTSIFLKGDEIIGKFTFFS